MFVVLQPCKDYIGRDPAGSGLGVLVNARRDAWESDRRSLFLSGQPQGVLVARTKQVRLALSASLDSCLGIESLRVWPYLERPSPSS
jgi:hypothetical protein